MRQEPTKVHNCANEVYRAGYDNRNAVSKHWNGVVARPTHRRGYRHWSYGCPRVRNFSMELATSPGSIKEIVAFTMMPNTMPVRLESLH